MFFRKQSLFYALALALGLLLPSIPFLGVELLKDNSVDRIVGNPAWPVGISTHVKMPIGGYIIGIELLGIILVVMLLATLLVFKDRKRQLSLGKKSLIVSLVASLLCASMAFIPLTELHMTINDQVIADGFTTLPLHWTFYAFAAANLFIFLGNRGVRKDIDLIESINRIR